MLGKFIRLSLAELAKHKRLFLASEKRAAALNSSAHLLQRKSQQNHVIKIDNLEVRPSK